MFQFEIIEGEEVYTLGRRNNLDRYKKYIIQLAMQPSSVVF
jgi:hypothetical protein